MDLLGLALSGVLWLTALGKHPHLLTPDPRLGGRSELRILLIFIANIIFCESSFES